VVALVVVAGWLAVVVVAVVAVAVVAVDADEDADADEDGAVAAGIPPMHGGIMPIPPRAPINGNIIAGGKGGKFAPPPAHSSHTNESINAESHTPNRGIQSIVANAANDDKRRNSGEDRK
jgi:hypothetical protein